MADKPTAPPGYTSKSDSFANDADPYADLTDEYLNSDDTADEVVNDSSIDTEASSVDTSSKVAEDKPTDKPVEKTTTNQKQEKVKVPPQKIAYTSDGRVLNLPLPNSLRKYASYNYILGLYALTNEEVNDPDGTYIARKPSIAILQSGGGLGNSKVLTGYETNGKKVEFFCNSLEIETIIAPTRKKGTTNAVGFRLEIMEPYSMGLFLQALQVGAYQANHENYLEAPFLLTIDFVGHDSDGNTFRVPEARKNLPFKLVGSDLAVTEGGSSYVVEGVAYNEGALTDATQSIPVDVTLTGKTLEQLLQSSPKSLSNELNKHMGQKAIDGKISTADQYFVVFPKKRASAGQLHGNTSDGGSGATTASTNSAVSVSSGSAARSQASAEEIERLYQMIKAGAPPPKMDDYIADLRTRVRTTTLGQEITEKQTGEGNSNEIGNSKMFALEKLGTTQQPFGDASFTYDKEKNVWNRSSSQMQIVPGLGEIKFLQGTRIQDIIEELVILSEYGRDIVSAASDNNGMKKWFKIDTQVFNITDPATEKKTGKPPRIYVFRILPYKVHEAKFLSPDKIPYGVEALKAQVCKEYDYIYSGKNDDILDLQINLDNTFFKAVSPGNLPKLQDQEGAKDGEEPKEKLVQTDVDNDQMVSGKTGETVQNDARAGGAVSLDDMRIDVARRFNDAIVNSDVDMITIEATIWGDPYYIADSGIGNYNSENTQFINLDSNGGIDYQYGEVDVVLNFRTPIDYRENGLMAFPEDTIAVDAFSGLYQVITVKNTMANGEFKQVLELVRRPNQYPKKPTAQAGEKSNQEIVPEKKDVNKKEPTKEEAQNESNSSVTEKDTKNTTTTTTTSTSKTTTTSTSETTTTTSGGGYTERKRAPKTAEEIEASKKRRAELKAARRERAFLRNKVGDGFGGGD